MVGAMGMEIRSVKKRGRKRKIIDAQNGGADEGGKKKMVGTRSKRLVGCYVRKEFGGSGVYLGKIVSYDSGLYRVDYEDGDCEDLDSGEVRQVLMEESDIVGDWLDRKHKLDSIILSKVEVEKAQGQGNGEGEAKVENAVLVDGAIMLPAANEMNDTDAGLNVEVEGVQRDVDDDNDDLAASDSCEDDFEQKPNLEAELPVVPPLELPPSSGNIGVSEEYVSHLLSVYSFLRSFSIQLFLSPFGLDEFVGSINCSVPNTLLDSIHVALMRSLRHYIEKLSADGLELASKCLRGMDWTLLDTLTWPIFLIHYLTVMGYTNGPEWKGFYVHTLEREYYTLSAGRKLIILQILCDDVLDAGEVRTEIDAREESEVGIDHETGIIMAPVTGPRRVHPKNSKTSACKDQEAMHIITQSHETEFHTDSRHLGSNRRGQDALPNMDEDKNSDDCRLCGMDGTLLCCDGCPASYHSRCIGVYKLSIPQGAWFCPECTTDNVGPKITRGTSLKAAEIFGVDIYGQVFLGTCDHLLVLNDSNSCYRYYHKNEISNVLQSLLSNINHRVMYLEMCKAIIQYWEIPDMISITEADGIAELPPKEDAMSLLTSPNVLKATQSVDTANLGTMNKASMVADGFPGHVGQEAYGHVDSEHAGPFSDISKSEENEVKSAVVTDSLTPDSVPSDCMGRINSDVEAATCTSKAITGTNTEHQKGSSITPKLTIRIKGAKNRADKNDKNLPNTISYMGFSFKIQGYVNNYLHGYFASSAAANLGVLSSEENPIYGSNASDHRKAISANVSLQVKAFSLAAIRFFWPNTEKKLNEIIRERCSWCLSCKAIVSSKRGCLLNAAASNAIKSSMKIISGLRYVKSGDGFVSGIAMYIIFMEESLSGLAVGPFQSSAYRSRWRKRVEQSGTCRAIKSLLFELEENIRSIALSGDWFKQVDGCSADSSVTQSATIAPGSTQKRRPGRRGRKSAVVAEVPADDDQETSTDTTWWRGGKLNKLLLRKAILPRALVKKAAQQGGSRKIPGVCYAESSEAPKISRGLVWRAAVEMSRNVSQLALQVRYLDLHVRWNDLSRPEQTIQDAKGPETEASAFRNAYISDKRILGNDIRYCVAFGSQKHLPSRLKKNVIEVEKSQDGQEKYWFSETRIPLYLIKEYEENVMRDLKQSADKPANAHVKLNRKNLKSFHKDIFSYLVQRRANMVNCRCAFCDQDLLFGDAVGCNSCQGLCHEQCTVSSTPCRSEEVGILNFCKHCYYNKGLTQNGISYKSSASPILLQGKLASRMINKAEKFTDCGYSSVPAKSLQPSSELKSVSSSKAGSKSKRKLLSWGLIRKKKNNDDNGIEFRTSHILMKGAGIDHPDVCCQLCRKPYNSDLMYIRCEVCLNWHHAEAVGLEESKISELFGYKCCRCRRIRSADCPYSDKIKKRNKVTIQDEKDSDLVDIITEPAKMEPSNVVLPTREKVVRVENDPSVQLLTEQKPSADGAGDTATLSWSPLQKLPVRRQNKLEKDDGTLNGDLPISDGSTLNSVQGSSSNAHWDAENGTDDTLMFNYEDLSVEDMEFEPQTYFSFNELLASDDVAAQNLAGSSGNVGENWESPSFLPADEVGDASFHQEDSAFNGEFEIAPCRVCSGTDPCPDLWCEMCGIWIHSHCSPWNEVPLGNNGWRCGICREWV